MKTLIILILSTQLATRLHAKDSKKIPEEIDTHTLLSEKLTSFATTIDKFFADESNLNFENKTQLRLFTDTFIREAQGPQMEGDVRFQLQLPGTQKRMQLILESNDEAEDDKNQPAIATRAERSIENRNNNTKAGLQYLFKTPDIKTSLGSGVIFEQLNPRFFARLRLRKNISIKKWLFKPEQEVFWIVSGITSTQTEFDFDRKISDALLFRFVNRYDWDNEDYEITSSNGATLFHQIDEKIGMSYNFRVKSSEVPEWAANNYILSVGYRQLLYKDWFFWTFSPNLSFPRENRFHRVPGLTVRFEVIIGRI